MKLTIDNETFGYLSAFNTLTGVSAIDCFLPHENEIVYVVEPGKIGMAVGKNGANIKKVEGHVKKQIRLVEYSNDPITFVRNVLYPLKVPNIYISTKSSGEKVINLKADARLKKVLLKDRQKMLKLIAALVERHFPQYRVEVTG